MLMQRGRFTNLLPCVAYFCISHKNSKFTKFKFQVAISLHCNLVVHKDQVNNLAKTCRLTFVVFTNQMDFGPTCIFPSFDYALVRNTTQYSMWCKSSVNREIIFKGVYFVNDFLRVNPSAWDHWCKGGDLQTYCDVSLAFAYPTKI
jgi:hypothetical protein